MKPDKLEQIRLNHKEREGISTGYNPRWDYQKEAVQQHNEMDYLLNLLDIIEELANVQIRQAVRKSKTQRKTIGPRSTGPRKKKTQKR